MLAYKSTKYYLFSFQNWLGKEVGNWTRKDGKYVKNFCLSKNILYRLQFCSYLCNTPFPTEKPGKFSNFKLEKSGKKGKLWYLRQHSSPFFQAFPSEKGVLQRYEKYFKCIETFK